MGVLMHGTRDQLRAIARDKGIAGRGSMTKGQLAEAIVEHERATQEEVYPLV
jgi:hypothetical protein